jgi:hypothetical protein
MTNALAAPLAARTTGAVWTQTGSEPAGYDRERSGFNLALDHRPALVLAAETAADIVAGVRFAADSALPVDIQATGHGAHNAIDGGLLITTRRLTDVAVDPVNRRAWVSAGATSGDVITATAPHGLAAAVGSAPGVGFVSYCLGGVGMLGRTYGWGADQVRSLNVVTADGRELVVTRDREPELFWALRGGGGNLAAVTAIEIDLLPVSQLYGGCLFYDGKEAGEILARFRQCTADAPTELSLSVAFVALPDLPFLPPPIRGRYCGAVRVAYVGGAASADDGARAGDAERLIAPLRGLPALLDSIRPLPLTEIGTVHADPAGPMPVHTDSTALRTGDAVDQLADLLEPSAPFMVEVRHLGAALAEAPAEPNAVGHRGAQFNLFTSVYPGRDLLAATEAQRLVYDAVAPTSAGGPLRTFLPNHYPDASICYEPAIAARLAELKTSWDPANLFRYAPGVTLRPE